MSNPVSALVAWLVARPCASHAVVSALETLALACALHACGAPHAPLIAALVVSTFYYGREAGQHEHDLKNRGMGPLLAFAGSEFGFLWGWDNLVQWLAAVGATAAVAVGLMLAGV